MKKVVTISRKWNSPEIFTTISHDGISLEMDMKDFAIALLEEINIPEFVSIVREDIDLTPVFEALKKEIGSVTFTFTQKAFEKKFQEALSRLSIEKIVDAVISKKDFEVRLLASIKRIESGIKAETLKVI